MGVLREKLKLLINPNISTPDYSLPDEYQEVEYIASTSAKTQHINTDYYCTEKTKIYIKLYRIGVQDTFVFGATTNSSNRIVLNLVGAGYPNLSWGSFRRSDSSISTGNDEIGEVILENNNLEIISGARPGKYNPDFSGYTFTLTTPLAIFCGLTVSGTASVPAYMRLYEFKIWESDEFLAWFTPCYHKISGEIGLYDRVRRRFFTNAGTGTFTKGNDVN